MVKTVSNLLVNLHILDPKNVGDLLSSPLQYFDFADYTCESQDLRTLDAQSLKDAHLIIGGGGLLYKRFLSKFEAIYAVSGTGKRVIWGAGQQIYGTKKNALLGSFDFKPYASQSDLVGIRDDRTAYSWVPCVSCMHPSFDKPRSIQHEVVVFSHKKFQVNIPGLPRMTNAGSDLEQVLDFLGSGETILTSSFHGAYWGILLGRKVLAFPFSSKFFTLRHQPILYPINHWNNVRWRLSLFGKTFYTNRYKEDKFTCDTTDWRSYLPKLQSFPESLAECRERNRWFYDQVLEVLSE